MLFGFAGAEDVNYSYGVHFKKIRDQGTMTAPPERLGAHDCSAALLREIQQPMAAGLEVGGHHVISVAAEGFIAPGGVRRIRPRPPPAAQFRKVDIGYACLREG